jgi:hypothetical protein
MVAHAVGPSRSLGPLGYPAPVLLGIDHLVIATVDPDAAAAELEVTLGLSPGGGGRHEGLGTYNRLVWLGDTYLELIGVDDPEPARASWVGAPTVRALARGGGLATWAVASDGLSGDLERLRARGAAWEGPIAGERRRPDGRLVRWSIAVPPRLDPDEPPFLIGHDPGSAEWTADDRRARAVEVHPVGGPVRLTTLVLPVPPSAMAARSLALLRTLDLRFRPSLAGRGARDASLGGQTVRLVPAPDGTPPTVHLAVAGSLTAAPVRAEVLGLRFELRSGAG